MVRWSLCEGRLNIKKRKKQSVPGKMVVVVRWSFYGRSFWPGGTVILTSRGSQGHTVRQQNGLVGKHYRYHVPPSSAKKVNEISETTN